MYPSMASPRESQSTKLSSYAQKLDGAAKKRYFDNISLLSGYDPFLGVPARATSVVPPVDACDLLSYLVLETTSTVVSTFPDAGPRRSGVTLGSLKRPAPSRSDR